MIGELRIKATAHGFGCEADLEHVSNLDKLEVLHCVATVLQMDSADLQLFNLMERAGTFQHAQTITQCRDAEELDNMLRGAVEKPEDPEQQELVELIKKLLDKLEG